MTAPPIQVFRINAEAMPKKRPRVSTKIDKNGRKRTHTFMPPQYKAWLRDVAKQLRMRTVPIGGAYAILHCDIYRRLPSAKISRKTGEPTPAGIRIIDETHPSWADADNLIGSVMDAGSGVTWDDDCQIDLGEIRRAWSTEDYMICTLELANPIRWDDERRRKDCGTINVPNGWND